MILSEDLKKSILNFSFIMTYTIHKVLPLIENNLNYLKDNIFECFCKKYNRLLIFLLIFLITCNDGKFKA